MFQFIVPVVTQGRRVIARPEAKRTFPRMITTQYKWCITIYYLYCTRHDAAKARFIRRILVASNAIKTIDNVMINVIKLHYLLFELHAFDATEIQRIKAVFQSSHEAPRSSLRVLASN
jgi:hypothetical protein